jgi:predicted permease
LVRWLAPRDQVDNLLGDLEERRFTTFETLEMAAALIGVRLTTVITGGGTLQDYKLGIRMLVKYPGLTLAGGLALAIAIGLGAGWYDFMGDMLRPRLDLPGGDRIVEIEMRDAGSGQDERRILHDVASWQRDAKSIEDLGAYRTVERNLILGDATPEPVTVAETTASMFKVAGVPPILGRHLLDADEQPGATPVVVLGYDVWKRRFDGRADAIGQTVRLGRATTTIVGVMPEGFSFPVNHRMWTPLAVKRAGYLPLEGPAIRVFGRVAQGYTQGQANAELTTLNDRTKAASPNTHAPLSPRVLAWGGESPGDSSVIEIVVTYLPIILVLVVACANVGTLIYGRTATREAEITIRYALGATRDRIVSQLFVEALVLASIAAIVGLAVSHVALKWAVTAYYSRQGAALPFWLHPGLKLTTVLFAALLTVVGAALLGVLPAIKATGKGVQWQLRNLGTGGSTLRFGAVWTTAMIAQVALTVICIPAAMGITYESWRDRVIRGKFRAEQYLAVRLDVDQEWSAGAEESAAAFEARLARTYGQLEQRLTRSGVTAVTFGDRLPGMAIAIRTAEAEVSPGAPLVPVPTLWMAAVGPKYFQTFDVPIVAGRDFHEGDRAAGVRTLLVNENFARLYFGGATPVGRRLRFVTPHQTIAGPWFEIVGMVRDVGMQPTDDGEAPFAYTAASLSTAHPLVMGIRATGDPVALAQRVRAIALEVDPGLRLGYVRPLDDLVWEQDVPQAVVGAAISGIVGLGLFLSAAGIFSLMSVNIARRTREIGLRAALGATNTQLLRDILRHALVLIGSGIAAGNAVLLLFVYLSEEATLSTVRGALLTTSAIMLTVGLLACIEPARRALRIAPTDALKEF